MPWLKLTQQVNERIPLFVFLCLQELLWPNGEVPYQFFRNDFDEDAMADVQVSQQLSSRIKNRAYPEIDKFVSLNRPEGPGLVRQPHRRMRQIQVFFDLFLREIAFF